jgi:hypothetical protein
MTAIIRDALTRPKVCRPGTHDFSSGERCSECRVRLLEGAAWNPAPRRAGGGKVEHLQTLPKDRYVSRGDPKPVATTETCRNGHTGKLFTDRKGLRDCDACQVERNKRYRAARKAA